MGAEKYQKMVYERMQENFLKWMEWDTIKENELYAFLHMLKGTAGSVGLNGLSVIANEKLANLNETSELEWIKEQWTVYLSPLIEALSFYEANQLQKDIKEVAQALVRNDTKKEFILIIDNDMAFIAYLKNVLEEKGFSVIVAHNGKRGIELIYEVQPAIVFLDIALPDNDGFSILNNIKKIKKDRTFIAIMSSQPSKENRIRAYVLGAMDFVAKPVDEDILFAYVANRLAYRKELEYAIVIDELTQVYNRKHFEGQLKMLINQYEKIGEVFTVAIIDLDFFKKVNDTYGHLIGDEVLKGFATLVKELKREQDIACRYGGEEFVLLMPNTDIGEAYQLVEKIRQTMAQKVFTVNGTTFYVTFSSGVMAVNQQYKHSKKLLEAADQALYAAKTTGRNRTVQFDSSIVDVKKLKQLKVIVVDDVYIIRDMLKTHFEELAINDEMIAEVTSFGDGLTFLQSSWYDANYKYIILLDWMLPNMSGIDVLKEIRARYSSKEVIVSMLTGQTGEKYVLEAFQNGADDYIRKPFQIVDVSSRILRLAERIF
ncbi:diguanylate cyclase [Metasolibacillus meyeri]|uniref:Diguanylate cyclase n=1 Tax=Metasolibacillus meyeri TaxID=1071052 RepID=A0AAW9NSI8_9BACL|nr:diguanylate cyclase [Metasolibacillus meyeri]MEC1178978.1 diguanylate cyclase [Metasolibacillus meyeri]